MIAATLLDIAKLAQVVPSSTSVDPGELVFAHLALPLPGDSPALGDSAFSVEVSWRVTTAQPPPDPVEAEFLDLAALPAPALLGTDFIAPSGLNQLTASFGLMPPLPGGPAQKNYWLVAQFTLRRAGAALQANLPLLTVVRAKSSPPVAANGLTANDLLQRLRALFKVEVPAAPVAPGAPVTAQLRPRGAEDAEWDVESASEVVPKYDLAAKVQLDPLFKPLARIVNGVFGITNRILSAGVRLAAPIVRILGAIGKAIQEIAGLGASLFGKKNPIRGLNVVGEIERLLRRLRIRDVGIFKGLDLPIDASVLNRNFTTNLVPHDAIPPLPGPRGLLPTLPTLDQQIEVTDHLPDAASALPLIGSLQIPLSITGVTWELWRPDVTVAAGVGAGAPTVTLVAGDAAKLPQATPFWLVWWNDTDFPDNPSGAGDREIVQVTAKGIPTLDSLSVSRGQHGTAPQAHNTQGKTYKMRLWPVAQLIAGPPVVPSTLTNPLPDVPAPPLGAAALQIPLAPADIAKLPTATPFWMLWFDAAGPPDADPQVEIVQVTSVTNVLNVVRASPVAHNAQNTNYRLRMLADYFEIGQTAGRLFKRTFTIEPPLQPDWFVELHVQLNSAVDPSGANLVQAVDLPAIPLRLVGFDPLALVAQQIELTAPVEVLEPGDELPLQLASAIPIQTTAPTNIQIPLPLGELPTRQLPISITWEVLDQNQQPLVEGTDYSLTGATATARSIVFIPALQIMRREEPAVSLRYVRVRLTMQNPALVQTVGPLAIPLVALQVPLFVAAFQKNFFVETDPDTVVVFIPEYYVTQAPSWVESWETFQSRLNDLQSRIVTLLAVAGGTPMTPLAAGSAQNLSDVAVGRLSLLRGALDYVANRPKTGKLEFLRGMKPNNPRYTAFEWQHGISFTDLQSAQTIIIANDAVTSIYLRSGSNWDSARVTGTPGTPLCVLWRNYEWTPPGDPWRFWWIPSEFLGWQVAEAVVVTYTELDHWHIESVSAYFDQYLRTNKYFPSPADLFT